MYNLCEKFALISLNGQQVTSDFVGSKLTSRCIVVAQVLQLLLDKKIPISNENRFEIDEEIASIIGSKGNDYTLSELIDSISQAKCNKLATEIVADMIKAGTMEIIPSLMDCDVNAKIQGLKSQQYRAFNSDFCNALEYIRTEVLGKEVFSDDVIILIWLLSEVDSLSCVFSKEEIEILQDTLSKLSAQNGLAKTLSSIRITVPAEKGLKSLFAKNTDDGKSIFIETEKMFSNAEERLENVKNIVEANGHIFNVISFSETPIVQIDNVKYQLIPHAIRVRVINVHGARLCRYVG